jgi:hypothetical protein
MKHKPQYKDKNTLSQINKHQVKTDSVSNSNTWYSWGNETREERRARERWLKTFSQCIQNKDKHWWNSLETNEQLEVANKYNSCKYSLRELMDLYPGNIAYQRDMKINDLLNSIS